MYVAFEGKGTFVRPNDEVPVSVRMMSELSALHPHHRRIETYPFPGTTLPS